MQARDGRTDRRTDRQSATQYAAPPTEEGRIIKVTQSVNQTQSTSEITEVMVSGVNLQARQISLFCLTDLISYSLL